MGVTLSSSIARSQFSKAVVATFKQETVVKSFFRSWFKPVQKNTDTLSYSTVGLREWVAKDVERGSQGNRRTYSLSKENIVLPPYYNEYSDITKMSGYDLLYGKSSDSNVDVSEIKDLMVDSVEALIENRKTIERAHELQCSQALLTGVVVPYVGNSYNFGRSAASLVQLVGARLWSAPTTCTPLDDLVDGATFLRTVGKATGGTFDVIMGEGAFINFLNSNQVKNTAEVRRYELTNITIAAATATGGVFHGDVSWGSYRFRIWTYPSAYESSTETYTEYMPDNKVIMLPENPKFEFMFAGIPIMDENGKITMVKDQFVIQQFIDTRRKTNEFTLESCGLAVLKAKDQCYTITTT